MVVPKLRFKEFESKVEVRKLGNLSNIVVGFVGTVSDQYCDKNEGIPFVRTQNVRDGYFSVENLEYVNKEFHKKNKKSQIFNDDVLIARVGANMGMVCAVENLNTEANCANVIIIKKNPQLNSQYLSLFLNSENGQKQIHSGGAGGAQAVFNTTLAKEIRFPYFPLEEQKKIASFLSAVDVKINQLTQKHQLLSQYKQGMMQKLFSQQIRFKADDGSEFEGWKSVFLGDISKPQQWKTISSSELTEIGYPVFGANGYIGFYPKYNHINETIAVTCRGATCGEVTLVKAKSYITGNAMSIDEINENEHSTLYIYYALCFRGFKDVISGSAQPQIVGNAIRKVTFQIPCLEEQTKIANFLSAIDQKIEVTEKQIEQAKQWKKGLLQQMFV